jgi:nifR3 family TIM-barrel protein
MLKLGDISLDVPFFQAPLSGYSDYAMRKLALENGAPFTFAGVMLAKSAAHPKILAKREFRPYDDEHPVGAQILGTDPEVMADAAAKLAGAGYDLIDLNFACPAPKVLRRGRGGALLKEPDLAIEIFRRVRQAVRGPLTVKLRTSFKNDAESRENFWRICETLAAEGVDGLIVHGRSVMSKFRGKADWNILAELKKKLPETNIIGSGDLFEAKKIVKVMNSSGIDGVVIARGAIGNPWLYSQLKALFKGEPPPSEPTLQEQGQMIRRHFELASELYPGVKAVRFLRKFLANYAKRHPDRRRTNMRFMAAKNREQLLEAIKDCYGVDSNS